MGLLLRQDRCCSRVGLPRSNGACPKPGQAQVLADQSSGRDQKHQIWSEIGRESTVWLETWSKWILRVVRSHLDHFWGQKSQKTQKEKLPVIRPGPPRGPN